MTVADKSQLSLSIPPKLLYAPENFLLHSGVKGLLSDLLALCALDVFGIAFAQGSDRSGKTHFSIRLYTDLLALGYEPYLLEGQRFQEYVHLVADETSCNKKSVLIIDDSDLYFSGVAPGGSGEFVHFIESLRVQHAKVICLSEIAYEDLTCDEHVLSRLKPGLGYSLESPQGDDVLDFIDALAKQRGLSFSERKLTYLSKRLPREVSAIELFLQKADALTLERGKDFPFSVLEDALQVSD